MTPVICHYFNSVSGICRFVEDHEDLDESDSSENKVNEKEIYSIELSCNI